MIPITHLPAPRSHVTVNIGITRIREIMGTYNIHFTSQSRWTAALLIALAALVIVFATAAPSRAAHPVRAWMFGTVANPSTGLEDIQRDIEEDHPGVRHMPTAELAAHQSGTDTILLLDIREVDEYAVSHIEHAERVDPAISRRDFLKLYGNRIKGRIVVFYCSVGVRSSKLADRLQDDLLALGAVSVWNLKGSIFAWHNEARRLHSNGKETPYVHPYDAYWSELLQHRRLARYNAE